MRFPHTPKAAAPASLHRKASPVTEQELIQACIREDRKAQQALYEQFAPLVMGICRRYLKSEEDAEDVLVETMYKELTR